MTSCRLTAAILLVGAALLGCAGSRSSATVAAVKPASTPPLRAAASVHRLIVGFSVDRRPIRAYVIGQRGRGPSVLVVGCVHGNETAGEAITAQLRHAVPPRGVALWLVDEFNPDGCTAHTRQNAHGVDLNRNSPWHWRPLDLPGGTHYSGTGPLSEPESRAINRLVKRLRPTISIWYHQHAALVDDGSGGNIRLERRYAEMAGLPLRNYGDYPGSITTWENATFPDATAFVVELPAGAPSRSEVARHVAAVLALANAVSRG